MQEFISITIIMFLAVISPGPDFAVVMKNSLQGGQKAGVMTCCGITLAIIIHLTYILLGLGYIVSKSIIVFNVIKFLGAAYLIYIGFKALKTKASETSQKAQQHNSISLKAAFTSGFLANLLNPKATLFLLALFSLVISPQTTLGLKILYGVWLATIALVFFSLLALVINNKSVKQLLLSFGHWFERVMGGFLIIFGLKLAFTSK